MLLELILLGLVAYLLLIWHRKEVEKGNEGLGAAGPILEELEGVVLKIIELFKKQVNNASANRSVSRTLSEAPTQKPSPRVSRVEKFESVRQPPQPKSRSKHHSRHRSKMDSALKAAQK